MAESVRTLLRHCLLKLKFLLGTIRPSGVSATSENATSDQLPSAPRQSDATDEERTKSCRTVATVIYALQGLAFLFAIPLILPSIVAVVIAHIKISEVRGTWLESHFLWQIRTFWFGLLWMIISVVIPLYLFELRALVVIVLLQVAIVIWLIYRVVKGWLHLNDGKEMYPATRHLTDHLTR